MAIERNRQKIEFFEIFRKFPSDNVTVLPLCGQGLEVCPEHEYIWDRRSDLTGAYFTIAATAQSTLGKTKEVLKGNRPSPNEH